MNDNTMYMHVQLYKDRAGWGWGRADKSAGGIDKSTCII